MIKLLKPAVAIATMVAASLCCGCTKRTATLQEALQQYIADQDARIGVAVIFNGTDTVEVNGGETFPMLSVYKFPQALAVADFCLRNGIDFTDTIAISADEIKDNTWSPLRETYGVADLSLPIAELLALTLQQSDNNACDILFRLIGGPAVADSLIDALGFPDIAIVSTEDEMHRDTGLCYVNAATPVAMVSLVNHFNTILRHNGKEYEDISRLMETCATGIDRLVSPLADSGAVIGHKTGTGDTDANNRIIAVNDCGYINLPDGSHYSIAVFINDSGADMAATSAMIAEISRLVFEHRPR